MVQRILEELQAAEENLAAEGNSNRVYESKEDDNEELKASETATPATEGADVNGKVRNALDGLVLAAGCESKHFYEQVQKQG